MEFPLVVLFLLWNECDGFHGRFKRVINGVPLNGRPSTYTAIRYYGALASTGNIIWNYIGYWDYVKPIDVWCSGSLLTPGIFQTACHCLAGFDKNGARYLKPPIIKHNWEGQGIVYVGVSTEDSFKKYSYIKTLRFIVHQKCAAFGKGKSAQYDYGLVQLDARWIKHDDRPPTYPWIEIEWAPQYTEQDMKDFYELALRKQLVCLIIGFGRYIRYDHSPSFILRTGWNTLLTTEDCIRETSYVLFGKNLTLLQHFNWVCSRRFAKHEQESGAGDSGGPFSCDNKYFGVLSGNVFREDNKGRRSNIITKHHPLVRTPYTNAIDYRNSFIHAIDDQPIYIDRGLEHDTHRNGRSSLKRLRTFPNSLG